MINNPFCTLFITNCIIYCIMAEKKDHRYKTVKIVMEAGQIKNFKDIFKVIPKSIVGKDMHTNNNRMQRLINNPGSFTYDEINQMADLIGCEYILLRDLVEKGARLGNKKEAKKSNEAKTKA
jgi:hypothetical protein